MHVSFGDNGGHGRLVRKHAVEVPGCVQEIAIPLTLAVNKDIAVDQDLKYSTAQ